MHTIWYKLKPMVKQRAFIVYKQFIGCAKKTSHLSPQKKKKLVYLWFELHPNDSCAPKGGEKTETYRNHCVSVFFGYIVLFAAISHFIMRGSGCPC